MINFLKDVSTPLETYYSQFKANEKKQLELLRSKTDEMDENEDNGVDDSEGEEEDIDITQPLKKPKKSEKQKESTTKNNKQKGKALQMYVLKHKIFTLFRDEDGGDTVQDLVLSDED